MMCITVNPIFKKEFEDDEKGFREGREFWRVIQM